MMKAKPKAKTATDTYAELLEDMDVHGQEDTYCHGNQGQEDGVDIDNHDNQGEEARR